MTAPRFDELIHSPTRLSIVSLLGASDWAEFKFIRETLGLSDSALSKQLTVLEGVGYIKIRKGFVGKRPRTWAKLSANGRNAFEGHVLKLQEIVSQGGISLGRETAPAATENQSRRTDPILPASPEAALRT